jgi:hypothetical protein
VGLWGDLLAGDQQAISKWKHYFPVYERHFARFVNTDVVFFEIGVAAGGSLQMWKRYLGPHARIVGIDINPECAQYAEDQIAVRIGNQADLLFLDDLCAEFGAPDIVLDDGSHVMRDISVSFAFLYPRLAKSGVYVVEDLHAAYWPEYDGGLGKPDTFIETCKQLIDELNADHTRGALQPTGFTRTTLSMHFYDSMVVFERGRYTEKREFKSGGH